MRWIALVATAALCTACVTAVELSPAIAPSASPPDRSSEAAAVVCAPDLLAHVERAQGYEVAVGEPLCSALQRSVEGTYRKAERVAAPYKGQFGRVVRFYLTSSALSVRRQPDGELRATYSVGVAVETCGRDLKPTTRKLVTGTGIVSRDARGAALVKEAAEAALQQLADNMERLLVAGLDGPRVRAPDSERAQR
jgi:hypothetical protein